MKILFVCASNICRSPYCEFVFRKMVENDPVLKGKIEVKSSAVFNQMTKINDKTRKVLIEEEGLDPVTVDAHVPSYVKNDRERFDEADVIIGMTKFQKVLLPKRYKKKYITLSEAAIGKYESIPDPWLIDDYKEYLKRMLIIKNYLIKYFDKLKKDFS